MGGSGCERWTLGRLADLAARAFDPQTPRPQLCDWKQGGLGGRRPPNGHEPARPIFNFFKIIK